jgi:OmcA/MtrC family decaheme c-type cytochrome
MALVGGTLVACGGGGGGSAPAAPPPAPVGDVATAVAAAGFTGGVSNATPTVNPKMVFQLVGSTPITINSPPVVNFTVVDASGKFVPALKLLGSATCGGSNMSFSIAKYDGVNWQSLISRQRYTADNVPSGKYSVVEGTTDPKPTATVSNPDTAITDPSTRLVGILEENTASNYYTYRFATDVTTPLLIANAVAGKNGVSGKVANNGQLAVKDGKTIHRVALQLCYLDPVTQATVKLNPYVDFTLASNGVGVPVKDAQGAFTDAKKVVDRASCNECHSNFAQHGGNRVDPNYCVVCHNAGSTDYNTNNPIDFKLMVHKFHMGKRLVNDYQVVGAIAKKTNVTVTPNIVTGVVYPQNQKNCVACHDGSATAKHKTANGDNWKSTANKNACFSCHDDYKTAGSNWKLAHKDSWGAAGLNVADPDASTDAACAGCHNDRTQFLPTIAAAHAVPQWTLGENYQLNILKVTLNPATANAKRTVTVRYSVSNPKDGTEYDLWDNTNYSYLTGTTTKTRNFIFGGLSILFGWNTSDYNNEGAMGRPWSSTCTTTVPAPALPTCDPVTGRPPAGTLAPASGTSAVGLVREGGPVTINAVFDSSVKRVGTSNQFELTSTELPDTASGTGAVAFQGRITLDNANALKLMPKMPTRESTAATFTVPVKNVVSYFALTDATPTPRRVVVSADKCNACHGKFLGFTSLSSFKPGWGGHGGSRNDPQVCVICHTGNAFLRDAAITGGVTTYGTSVHFKTLIHEMHKEQEENYPVWPLTTSKSTGAMAGLYTGIKNCAMCHEGDSWKSDKSVLGTSVIYDVGVSNGTTNLAATATSSTTLTGLYSIDVTPSDNWVISPKASTCYSCHSSKTDLVKDQLLRDHMIRDGGAQFGTVTLANLNLRQETCDNCHQASSSSLKPVDKVHGQ